MSISDKEWVKRLAIEAFERGDHIPDDWKIEYDDGADGCMPAGYYIIGYKGGLTVEFPVRHEYGPYESADEAQTDLTELKKAMGNKTDSPIKETE